MPWNEWVEGSPTRKKVLLALTIIVLVIATILILRNTGVIHPAKLTVMLWYYDLNTGKPFAAQDHLPPIDAPSGPRDGEPAGVRAYYFSCGDCSRDADQLKLVWLETFSPEVLDAINVDRRPLTYEALAGSMNPAASDSLVMAPGSTEWVSTAKSPQDAATIRNASALCPGSGPAHLCRGPDSK